MSSAKAEAQPDPCDPAPIKRVTQPRFHELDILRGVAAFTVVVFHYKHFLLDDTGTFDYHHMPFFGLLAPVYVYGLYFVELFFSISGYVFFWLYAEAIAQRRVGPGAFFVARFSRLYPLFLVTLLFVAVAQPVFTTLHGHAYIYTRNSAGDFALNLFMVQQWLPNVDLSFNGPSWSISVEVFLYAAFFVLCFFRGNRPWIVAAVVVFGLAFKYLQAQPPANFARGIPSFFIGGLVYYAVTWLTASGREAGLKRVNDLLVWLVPVLWCVTYVRTHPLLIPLADWLEARHIGSQSPLFGIGSFINLLIPLTLLAIGLRRGAWLAPEKLKAWAWLGDISYSIYLIHFPLQLLLMIFLAGLPFPTRAAIFSSPFVFIAFMVVVTLVSRFSFTHFEMPMRRFLNTWLSRRLVSGPPIG